MSGRTRTIASLFAVAMGATLVGAFVTAQIRRPEIAEARPATGEAVASHAATPMGLDTFRDIARRTTAAVVNINTTKVIKRPRFNDPFREFFGDDLADRFLGPDNGRQKQQSLGSGFVIDKDGYVLTNRHVVEGADEVRVTFSDNTTADAKIVGQDARTDVALLKTDTKKSLTALEIGDSDQLEVGEWVMAIGNPFGLGGNSVTVGVVSYKGRELPLGVQGTRVDMIQTDAAINPGNSGGPLLNTRGQVVGINTMIITGGERQSAGVGFSVPINVAKDILPQLRDKGKVVRGWLGVQILPVTEDLAQSYGVKEAKGAVVAQVTPNSPAEKAGLKAEDLILSIDGRPLQDNSDLSRYIASKAPGTTVKLTVRRDTPPADKEMAVVLGTFPDEPATGASASERSERLGMTLEDLSPALAERLEMPRGSHGALVRDVEPGSPADRAGLERGNVIVSANGEAVASVTDFQTALDAARKAGGTLRLRVRAAGGAFRVLVLRLQ
jgi:serine protease Do